ncbi:ubiquinone biosynthesis protein UbiB [Amycolatopsis antarctica]|uniref:Ubiquinone biosynthesis protein UbiB n=1 Tax=Amycolatopsis antarctica TaxID=1854586 RepID=A0A263D4P3_9PSEU|nr:AarF/UbiB family protein [Amycolatopsis antarctica]OZM72345.1 ubiquinone biosynthesis protein UbiB [Amycolatopsis antarctica]
MSSFVVGLISLPLHLLMSWPLVGAARRVLGVRIGLVRALAGAAVGWVAAGAIVVGLPVMTHEAMVPALVIPIAGGAFLVTLVFLFVAELALPSGGAGLLGGLRSLRRRARRTRRYSQITRIAVRHGLGPYLTGRRDPGSGGHRHAVSARSFRLALEQGGTTFVKLGQVLSTRPDVLPPAFIAELGLLRDSVAHAPADAVRQVLREELGADPDEVFAEFHPEPLGAASVAQVYRARLRSGEDVVVKVRRPGIATLVERDLDIVHRVARSLHQRASWARDLGIVDLAEGFAAALTEELDFRIEARNLAAVAAASAGGVVTVPVVHAGLSTERVLVMQRLDGVSVTAAPRRDRTPLATALLDCVLRQVLLHGLFHADPHPGNVLLLADGRIGLLDFGSVGRIDTGLRDGLRALLLAVDRGDPAALRDGLLEIVDRPDEIDERRLERALGALVARHLSHGQAPDLELFTDMFRIVADFRLSVPPPIAAVFRALATMEGTLALLAPGFDVLAGSRAFAAEQIGERLRPDCLRQAAADELLALLPVIRRLPQRLDRIGGALEQGRLSVNVRLLADERDRTVISGWLHEVLLAMTGTATGLMAVLLLASTSGPRVLAELTLNHLFGYNLLVVSALVGLRLLFLVFREQRRRAAGAG